MEMYADTAKYLSQVFDWLRSAPGVGVPDPGGLAFYVESVNVACDSSPVGTFKIDFDDEYVFNDAEGWFNYVPPKTETAAPTNHEFARIAEVMYRASYSPMPETKDRESFVHGYTHAMNDMFEILGYVPEEFNGVVLPGPWEKK
jgi:hypothetical protein